MAEVGESFPQLFGAFVGNFCKFRMNPIGCDLNVNLLTNCSYMKGFCSQIVCILLENFVRE